MRFKVKEGVYQEGGARAKSLGCGGQNLSRDPKIAVLHTSIRGGWNASRDQRFYMGNVHKNDKYESRGC